VKPATIGLVTLALLGASIAGALGVRSCVAQRAAADLELEAVAFERGLTFGLEIAAAVGGPSTCLSSPAPLPVELDACEARIADYRRTEAANRANARELGLNEGLRLGREDWHVRQWECRGGLSDAARLAGVP